MYCRHCGLPINDDSLYCFSCGTKVNSNSQEITPVNIPTNSRKKLPKINRRTIIIVAAVLLAIVLLAIVVPKIISLVQNKEALHEAPVSAAVEDGASYADDTLEADDGLSVHDADIIESEETEDYESEKVKNEKEDSMADDFAEGDETNDGNVSDNIYETWVKIPIESAYATSTLYTESVDGMSYEVANLIDGDMKTTWCEGEDDLGVGQMITLHFPEKHSVVAVRIFDGFLKTKRRYAINGKVSDVNILSDRLNVSQKLTVMDMPETEEEFKADQLGDTIVYIPEGYETDELTLVIMDAVAGTKYDDVGISDITVYEKKSSVRAYDNILSDIRECICDGTLDMEMTGYSGITEVSYAYSETDCLSNIGFMVSDIDQNGTDELIIAEKDYDGKYQRILAVYTMMGDEPILLFEGWSRNRYYLLPDGRIYNEGSSGAAYTEYAVYNISADGLNLETVEAYFTDYDATGEWSWFSSKTNSWDPEEAEWLGQDFEDDMEFYYNQAMIMDMTSLLEYVPEELMVRE